MLPAVCLDMEAQLKQTPSGYPSLVRGDVWLDDPRDPLAAAVAFGVPLVKDRRVIVFGPGLGYRLLRIADIGAREVIAFDPDPRCLELAKSALPQVFEGVLATHDLHELVQHLTEHPADFVLLSARPYQEAYPEAHEQFTAALQRLGEFTEAEKVLIQDRVHNVLETALRNIPRLKTTPYALSIGRPLENTPAIIVSAGPSLDKNVHLLKAASEKSAIIAVNTAVPVMKKHGIPVDVAIGVEALSIKKHLENSGAKATVLCGTADSECYDLEGPVLMFVKAFAAFEKIAADSHVAPLPYGSSVATAAVCLVKEWGASDIILVGQDLACPEGRYYATGTGREEAHIKHDGPFLYLETCTDDDFRAKNISLPSRYQPRLEVDAWGGGRVSTTRDLHNTVQWLAEYAEAADGSSRLINATEGGASISNWEERPLQQVLSEFGPRTDSLDDALRSGHPVDAAIVDRISNGIRERARVIARLAEGTLRAESADQLVHRASRTTRLVRADPMMALLSTFAIHKRNRQIPAGESLSSTETIHVHMETIRDCAARVVEICDQVRQLPESDIADAAE